MKRAYLLLTAILCAAVSSAQLAGDGYYRVQNVRTSRYIRVVDSYGSIDVASTTADMTAIQTIKNFENVCSDPASVVYIQKKSSGYNLYCQGTDTYTIIGYYPLIADNGNGTYKTYAERAGMVAYLADEISLSDEGVVVSNSKNSRDWYILPINQTDEHWFGLTPDITAGGVRCMTFFAEFAYSFHSAGMKASIVTKIDEEQAAVVYEDWTGDVPGATPVIVTCSTADANGNRLDIHKSSLKAPKENLMKGVYFCNPKKKTTNPHHNVVNNDPATMRILGVTSDGSLGFVKCTDTYLPRNRAYITVSASAPAELKLYTKAEYEALQPVVVIDEEAFGKENGNGWFRLTNVATGRVLALAADAATPAGCLTTLAAGDDANSHLGTVFRIDATEGGYTLRSQGVDLTAKAGSAFRLWKNDDDGSYTLFSTSGDSKMYIGCAADGTLCDEETTAAWTITPAVGTCRLTVPASASLPYWTTFYADFPCTLPASATPYIVTALHTGDIPAAIIAPLGSQAVPAGTPLLLRCTDHSMTLAIGETSSGSAAGNLLEGTLLGTKPSAPYYTATSTGRLQYNGSLARNSAFVPANGQTMDALPFLSQEEYDALVRAADEKERTLWFANHCTNGWYRLKQAATDQYLTLTSPSVEGLVAAATGIHDVCNIFRVDADQEGIVTLQSQGTDVSKLLGGGVTFRHNDDDSYAVTGLEGSWVVEAVISISPELTLTTFSDTESTMRWGTLCTPFSYTVSDAVRLYTVKAVHGDVVPAVVWERFDSRSVPAEMPVIICELTDVNTRFEITISDAAAVAPDDNLLQGTLFSTQTAESSYTLAVNASSLVFQCSNERTHPANSAWLPGSSDLADVLPLMTDDAYQEALLKQGIHTVSDDATERLFFTITGRAVRSTESALPAGIYISEGRKFIKR